MLISCSSCGVLLLRTPPAATKLQPYYAAGTRYRVPGTAIFRLCSSSTVICGCWNEANVSASKITFYRSSVKVWRVEISYVCSIVAQRPGDGDLDCGGAWCRCTGRDQTSMVGWLTGIQYLHILAVHRIVTVVQLRQEFHDSMCEYRVLFAIFSTVVANGTCTETGNRRRVNGTRRRQVPTEMWLFTTDQYKPQKVRENIMLRTYI